MGLTTVSIQWQLRHHPCESIVLSECKRKKPKCKEILRAAEFFFVRWLDAVELKNFRHGFFSINATRSMI